MTVSSGEGEERIPIAVDAMGGDQAPQEVVAGCVSAYRDASIGVNPILVGDEALIRRELVKNDAASLPLEIVHTEQAVGMEEGGAKSFRRKRGSSMSIATRMVREGKAKGAFSAGNTGAMVAASILNMGRISGVHRPALATPLPALGTPPWVLLLDVGATADCKPLNLLQFAVLGEIYYRILFDVERPRVGLLNIGEETSKGNELTQEAYGLLKDSHLIFSGNVEGKDVLGGTVQVVVADGFTGNVMLKFAEGIGTWAGTLARSEIGEHVLAKFGALLLKPSLRRMRQRMDYSEYGGAPLLGVDGISLVGHGRSNAKAIHSGVRLAADLVRSGLNAEIRRALVGSGQKGGEEIVQAPR